MISLSARTWLYLGVFGLVLFVLIFASQVAAPLVLSFVGAYMLNPLVRRLIGWGLPRTVAVSLMTLVFLSFVMLVVALLTPLLLRQIPVLVEQLPAYVAALEAKVIQPVKEQLESLTGQSLGTLDQPLASVVGPALTMGSNVLASLRVGGAAIASTLTLMILTPVCIFYFLLDWNALRHSLWRLVPRPHVPAWKQIMKDIDACLAGFLRGQALVCLFLATWYGVGLGLVGLKAGLLIGVLAGLFSFIPFVGSGIGFLIALTMGVFQFNWDPLALGGLVAVFVSGQLLEGNVLAPRLVGASVGLHPVAIIFSVFAFGAWFGFVGMLVAVPSVAILAVLMRHAFRAYTKSSLYHDQEMKV